MPNRRALFASLQKAIVEADDSSRTLGLLLLRIRRLRETNRLLGYDVGEAFVDAVQAEIEAAVRASDEVWRAGEGEFAVILPGLHDRNHAALAAGKLLRVLGTALPAAGHHVLPVVSIGIATLPRGTGLDAQALYKQADQACEQANSSGERYTFYEVPTYAYDVDHGDLRDALASNALELHLQPISDLRREDVIGRCEALLRWRHPSLGAIPPEAFVRMAEQTGQISELTRWSLNAALRQLAESGLPISVAVNIAVDALRQPGFREQVNDMLRFWGVAPERLVLEITESGLMTDPAYCARVLGLLREDGISAAIDDFGTGYSSMTYLRKLPASELKIDRSFVMDMREDVRARKLVASMIDVSHHLGMEAVAEGVEDAETLELLRALGCDYAQGFFIGRPAPAAEVLGRLAGD